MGAKLLEQLTVVLKTIQMQGNPDAPYWFMGLEEGTDASKSAEVQIKEQYDAANHQKEHSVVPLGYARELKTYQPTWGGYIKLLLSLRDSVEASSVQWDKADVLDYQRNILGDLAVTPYGTALLELFPLPRKCHNSWVYEKLADQPGLEFLATPQTFAEYPLVKSRASSIVEKVEEHQPRVLFCFGRDGENALTPELKSKVTELSVKKNDEGGVMSASIGTIQSTVVVFCNHPGSFPTDLYWRELGKEVAQFLPPLPPKQMVA